MQPSSTIDVRDLTKDFGRLRAVDSADLCVERGEVFGLVGPDGAGKTTILRMLAGVTAPTSGGGSILGYDIVSQREDIKKHTGYVSQRFSLYEDLSVEENLDFFSEIYETPVSERSARVKRMLEFSRLAEFRGRLVRNLSGGMRQKLALACAMTHSPEVLFLDEPTAGVDPVSRRDFWNAIGRLTEEGITIVVSTVYTNEAAQCSRLAMMDGGRIVAVDTSAAFRERILHGGDAGD